MSFGAAIRSMCAVVSAYMRLISSIGEIGRRRAYGLLFREALDFALEHQHKSGAVIQLPL